MGSIGQCCGPPGGALPASEPGEVLISDGSGGWQGDPALQSISQAAWFIDSVAGNDTNDGTTALTALQTIPELGRRINGRNYTANAVVTLAGTFPAQTWNVAPIVPRGVTFDIIGAATTVLGPDTITTYTARSGAGNTSATLLSAATSFAASVGRRIRITIGANAGAVAWVLADLGGNTCRVSAFISTAGTVVVPANGDTFVVETLNTVIGGVSTPMHTGGGIIRMTDVEIQSQNALQIHQFYASTTPQITAPGFFRCKFGGATAMQWVGGTAYNACCFQVHTQTYQTGDYFEGGSARISSAMSIRHALVGSALSYNCHDGTSATLSVTGDAVVQDIVDRQFFGQTGAQTVLLTDNAAFMWQTGIFHYGVVGTTVAYLVRSGCMLGYVTNKPGILGNVPGVNDIKLGGTDFGWGAIPAVNALNNAAAVVRQ
jgi:hypothetical protein